MIIHIAGAQGSGKTTLGNKLKNKYKIVVKDLDDLHTDFVQTKKKSYQQFIYSFIKLNKNKSIIFTGLDADICLGNKSKNNYYDLKADYKYYIDIDENIILKQRFLRQVNKLYNRKDWFINTYLKSNEKFIQDKILRFINISSWKKEMKECKKLYKSRKYKFKNREEIYNNVIKNLYGKI